MKSVEFAKAEKIMTVLEFLHGADIPVHVGHSGWCLDSNGKKFSAYGMKGLSTRAQCELGLRTVAHLEGVRGAQLHIKEEEGSIKGHCQIITDPGIDLPKAELKVPFEWTDKHSEGLGT